MKTQEKFGLNSQDRNIFGKQIKKLRREGQLPANVYGPGFTSKAITVVAKDFLTVYRKAKETGIIYLKSGKDEIPTLIKNVQKHPIEDLILHVDFRKIDLSQKIETNVPVTVTGDAPAIDQGGVLITQHDHLLVEALPNDIPQTITVNISALTEIGQDIKVSDLPKSDKYIIKNEPETVIVSVTAHKEESLIPETAPAEAPEVLTEKEGEEAVEAAPTVEGTEAPAQEEGKKESPEDKEKKEKTPKE